MYILPCSPSPLQSREQYLHVIAPLLPPATEKAGAGGRPVTITLQKQGFLLVISSLFTFSFSSFTCSYFYLIQGESQRGGHSHHEQPRHTQPS